MVCPLPAKGTEKGLCTCTHGSALPVEPTHRWQLLHRFWHVAWAHEESCPILGLTALLGDPSRGRKLDTCLKGRASLRGDQFSSRKVSLASVRDSCTVPELSHLQDPPTRLEQASRPSYGARGNRGLHTQLPQQVILKRKSWAGRGGGPSHHKSSFGRIEHTCLVDEPRASQGTLSTNGHRLLLSKEWLSEPPRAGTSTHRQSTPGALCQPQHCLGPRLRRGHRRQASTTAKPTAPRLLTPAGMELTQHFPPTKPNPEKVFGWTWY